MKDGYQEQSHKYAKAEALHKTDGDVTFEKSPELKYKSANETDKQNLKSEAAEDS